MVTALLVMIFLAILLGLVLGYSAIRFKVDGDPMVARIDAILPQTQCGQCGFPGCKPLASHRLRQKHSSAYDSASSISRFAKVVLSAKLPIRCRTE
jgi:RnfABCDGE-type electron transport complex B subunit